MSQHFAMSFRHASRRLAAAVALAAAATVGTLEGCRDATTAPATQSATLPFYAQFNATGLVQIVVVTVSGPGISPNLVFNIPVVAGVASGSLTLPVGSSRLVKAEAFDAGGGLLYSGSTTVTVNIGANPAINIALNAQVGTVTVTATIGSSTIAVSPTTATLRAGASTQLTATVKDAQGNTITPTLAWASSNPPYAWPSATGLVTALDTGAVPITVSALGNGASATITVTPGTSIFSLRYSTTSVSAAAGSAVNFTAFISDISAPGVDSVAMSFAGPSGAPQNCMRTAPTGGTRAFGSWICPFSIATGAPQGAWGVTSMTVYWGGSGGGVANYLPEHFRARGLVGGVTVTP